MLIPFIFSASEDIHQAQRLVHTQRQHGRGVRQEPRKEEPEV
jgi:hypothetical protein